MMLSNTLSQNILRATIFGRYLLLFTVLLVNSTALASTLKSIPGSTTVDSEDVVNLIVELPELVIIDARIASDRLEGYIEGSVSLSNIDTDCENLEAVLKSLQTPVLFYCNGINCERSEKSAQIAVSCGYSEIYWFRGGIEEWKYKQYPLAW